MEDVCAAGGQKTNFLNVMMAYKCIYKSIFIVEK